MHMAKQLRFPTGMEKNTLVEIILRQSRPTPIVGTYAECDGSLDMMYRDQRVYRGNEDDNYNNSVWRRRRGAYWGVLGLQRGMMTYLHAELGFTLLLRWMAKRDSVNNAWQMRQIITTLLNFITPLQMTKSKRKKAKLE